MRSRFAVVSCVFLFLLVLSALPVLAQESDASDEPEFFTVSAGWSWPAGGPVQDTYESGLTIGGSFRIGVAPGYVSGFEVGYSWYSLNTSYLADKNPGSTFSGGDMGMLSITTENDYLFGRPESPFRPLLNLGIGFYRSFIDDATQTTGSTTEDFWTGVYHGSFFGLHGGIGGTINRDRFGIRVDANYVYLFAGGDNLEFFTARGGIIFYM